MNNAPKISFVVQPSGVEPVPVGSCLASFQVVEPLDLSHKGIAEPKIKFVWQVESGSQKGRIISALTDAKITNLNHAGRLISGMIGNLKVGVDVEAELDKAKGKNFICIVNAGPKGGKPSVQNVSGIPAM